MTPIGLADDLRQFGTIFGQVVGLKNVASKYAQTYQTWQDLVNRGENLRQVAATFQNMGAVTGQLESLIAGIAGSLFPASILPAGINQANLYAISGWENDANAFIKQLQQISALEQSGLTSNEVSAAIQPTGIAATISGFGKSIFSGVSNVMVLGLVAGGIYLYFMNRRK